ncbi:MAG TPA: hypothetical protein VGY77_03285 [Gemmataceae bacterium]|jgi:hypothetical protein|nr:hypothetical protein [Gemmataceae bacterium]
MRWYRTLLFSLFGAAVVFPVTGLGQQQPPSAGTPGSEKNQRPSMAPKPQPEGTKILEEAVRVLDRKNHDWLETIFWQQADLQGLTFQTEGKYLSGPNYRLRLDLKVYLGDSAGTMLVVSDGITMWERFQIGKSEKGEIRKMDLKKVLETVNSPNMIDQVRNEFFQKQSLAGVAPVLKNIQQQMIVTRMESMTWQGKKIVQLTLVWSEGTTKNFYSPKVPWQNFLPRQCVLNLDADPQSRWPHRLEWWGPAGTADGDALLFQVEYRNPKLNQPPPKEQWEGLFTFKTERMQVIDRTKIEIEHLINRRNQLAQQGNKTPPPK